MNLDELYEMLQGRKGADSKASYVAKMFEKGTGKICQKIGEEATELVIDAVRLAEKPGSEKRRGRVISEAADLMFHFTMLLAKHDIAPDEVYDALEKRKGKGGLDEKAERE